MRCKVGRGLCLAGCCFAVSVTLPVPLLPFNGHERPMGAGKFMV